jgi:uncharacterized membrane protein YfcA
MPPRPVAGLPVLRGRCHVETALVSLALGAVIGLSLGLLGGGGSILTVPALVYVVGLPVAEATGTSLAIVGVTALVGAGRHLRAGRVDLHAALSFGAASMAGAVVGSVLGRGIEAALLLALFALLMIAAGAAMLRPARVDPMPSGRGTRGVLQVALVGAAVGTVTGFFGVGGGFLIVPALVLVLGLPMRRAVGTSLVVIALASAAGLVTHLGVGAIDLPVTLLFVVGGVAGIVLGTRWAGAVPELALRRGFATLVFVLAVFLLLRNGPAVLAAATLVS